MNKKIKRSTALVIAALCMCSSFSANDIFTKTSADQNVVSAAALSDYTSGFSNRYFYYKDQSGGITYYFSITDYNAKKVVLSGCTTTKEQSFAYIPETVQYQNVTYTVTAIGDNAFRGQQSLISVSLPKYATEIGSFAFEGCTNLKSVCSSYAMDSDGVFHCVLKQIGYNAFMNCSAMSSPCFFENVESIGDYAFYGCSSMSDDMEIPKLSYLGKYAFYGCYGLGNIDLSDSNITKISEGAFQYCSSSKNELIINLPSTVKTIEKYAFYNACGLRTIYIPNVTSVGECAFMSCHQLKNVLTGNSLSYIGKQAFYGCDPMDYFVCKNPNVTIEPQALGYDSMRNYTGRKTNFTLWSTNGGGKVKSYANYYKFTYKDTKDAPNEAIENFKPYMWSSGNVPKMFAEFEDGVKVNTHLYIDGHKPYVDKSCLDSGQTGSCYGMAAVSALVYNGYLSIDQLAPGYSAISDLKSDCSDYTKSIVNTVWADYTNKPDYSLSNDGGSAAFTDKDDEMLTYIEFITYGADVAAFSYAENSNIGGHAIVCLGMEFKENAKDKNTNKQWEGMDARILLYDVNWEKYDAVSCLYFNSQTGEWIQGVQYGIGTKSPFAYKSGKNPEFAFKLYYRPDSMVLNNSTPDGPLRGMDLISKLVSIKK